MLELVSAVPVALACAVAVVAAIGLARSLSGSKSSSSKLELVVSSVIRSRESSFGGGVAVPPPVDERKSGVSPF
uniref:Putative secreted protein n=1 Tax=Anopheles darlingi TaxID=43151 RepID=A0A2M4DQ72_ANODA